MWQTSNKCDKTQMKVFMQEVKQDKGNFQRQNQGIQKIIKRRREDKKQRHTQINF